MAIPHPVPGLVLQFAYLWRDEHRRGLEEGTKNRPCVIVSIADGTSVMIAPITHRPPSDRYAVAIPAITKRRLGLDDGDSWIIASDLNSFVWPGLDLRQVPGKPFGTFSYGVLPPALFRQLRSAIQLAAATRALSTTPR